jgi:peptidoglycan/xylan/chitin deacetylase (PgdA/CDA1 family)
MRKNFNGRAVCGGVFIRKMIIVYIIIFLFFAVMFFGVKFLSLNIFGKSICKIKNSNKIYLTFDDGPNENITPKVLDLLAEYKQKATFFCIAENAEKYPEIVKRIVADGHTLASHDLYHRWTSNFRRTKQMLAEIGESVQILEEISHTKIKYYRPPVGLSNPHLFAALKKLNLQCIGWSKSVCDGGNRNVWAINKIPNLANAKAGDIMLLHDNAPAQNGNLFLLKLEELFVKLEKAGKNSAEI